MGPCYLCDTCGWGTDDESALRPNRPFNALDLPRYVRETQNRTDDRPHAAGE